MPSPTPELVPPESPLDLLVVAAHPDDAEISVGGTLAKFAAEGRRAGVLDLTDGEPTPAGDPDTRAAETAAASKVLGLAWRGNLGLPNRSLVDDLLARRRLAEAFRLIRPRLVLTHFPEDAHPDHVAASRLTDAARFWGKLTRSDLAGEPYFVPQVLHYWSIHSRRQERPQLVLDISDQIDTKMRAVECYQSQLGMAEDKPFPTVLDDIRDRARYWGWAIGAAYGEPLGSVEAIRSTIESLLN